MNKNGFTLAEILGVIVIIGLLLLIVTPNLVNRINPKEEDITKLQEEMIKEAAGFYVDNHSECFINDVCTIDTDLLIKEGYLSDDFKDAKANEAICKKISITKGKTNVNITDGCE